MSAVRGRCYFQTVKEKPTKSQRVLEVYTITAALSGIGLAYSLKRLGELKKGFHERIDNLLSDADL